MQQPKTPIGVILGGPVALLDIAVKAIDMLFNPGPSAPGDPPLLLGVLAFVRREIQRSFFNSTPAAVADVATTSEGVPTRITVLSNDTDPNVGDILTVTDYTQGANGAVALNADGSFTYTPNAGFSGADTFTYTVSDDASAWHVHGLASLLSGHDSTATVTITVAAVNDAPEAVNDVATVNEDAGPTKIAVLANDSDAEGSSLVIASVGTSDKGGAVAINPDGTLSYTPTANFNGVDFFTYTISDGVQTATAMVTVTVASLNDAPTAVSDAATVAGGSGTTSINVLANDTDPDIGDALVVTAVAAPDHGGSVSINADKTIAYKPAEGFSGTETFSYTISDGTETAVGTVTVTVTPVVPVNVAPVATNDTFTMPVGATSATINVVSNDTDADGDTLAVVGVTGAANGTTTFTGGSIIYTPTTGFAGTEVLTYTVSDGDKTDTATLAITVPAEPPVNVAPVAGDDTFTMPAGAPSATINVVSNDTDADGDTLAVVGVTGATNGTTTFTGGSIIYTPTTGFAGTEVLTYTVSDGDKTDTATLTITVPAVNRAPMAGDDTVTMPAGATSATINVVSNDTDPDGDSLAVVGVTGATNGTATFTGTAVIYTPTAGFAGTEVLTYTVSDGDKTDTATLTITVPAVTVENHAPVVGEPAYEYETQTGSGIISGTLHVTDEDGDVLTFTVSGLPDDEVGTLAIDPETGAWQFKPTNQARFDAWRNPGEVAASFSITVSDGQSSVSVDVEASIAPAFYFDYHWPGTEVADAKSVVVLSSDGKLFADNADGLTVINPDGTVNEPILLGFRPTDAAFGTDGRLYLTDPVTDSISALDLETGVISQFASAPTASGLAFDSDGRLFVASPEARTITVIDSDGTITDTIRLDAIPTDVAVGADGKIYVTEIADDRNSVRLTVRNADGSVAAVLYDRISSQLGDYAAPLGLAVGANGAIFLADTNRGELIAFTSDGESMDTAWVDGMIRGVAVGTGGQIVVLSAVDNALVVLTPAAQDFDEEYGYTVDWETNVVTGELYVLNPGGHLTFELTAGPPSALGTVTVDEATGAWVFVPTAEAIAAAAYGEYDWSHEFVQDVDFVITVSDGSQISVNAPIFGDPEYGVDVIDEVGGSPTALTVGTDGRIYVANRDDKTITILNTDGSIARTIELDFAPTGVTGWAGGYVVVTNGVDNNLTLISVSGDVESSPLTGHNGAIDIIAIGDGGFDHDNELRFYIVGADSVSVYDAGFDGEFILDVSNPTGIALGIDGEIYIVGTDDDGVGYLRVYGYDGNLVTTTLLGGSPSGIALGPNNHLYISDRNGLPRDVAIVDTYGWVSQTLELGVNGSAVTVAPDGRVYVANADDGSVTVLTPPSAPPTQTPVGTVSTIKTAGITNLYGIAITPDGRIIVTGFDIETFNEFVLGTVEADGSFTRLADVPGTAAGVEIGPDGRIYVSDFEGTVTAYDPTNGVAPEVIATIPGATGLAFDDAGNLYVTSNEISSGGIPVAGSLHIIKPDGGSEVVALPGLSYDVQVAADGRVFVPYFVFSTESVTPAESGVLVLNADGTTLDLDLPPGVTPAGVAIGPDGTLFITSPPLTSGNGSESGRLIVRYPNGLTRAIEVGRQPFGLDFDAEGRLLITDLQSNVITVLDPIYDAVNEHAPTVFDDPGSRFTSASGVVAGAVIGADPDGDLLTYSVVSEIDPALGAIVVAPLLGQWEFTPTAQAQLSAWELLNNDPDAELPSVTFTINASDGEFSDAVSITVDIVPGTQPTAQDPAFTIVNTDPSSGLVSGRINVVDADGDALTYRLASGEAVRYVYLRYDTGEWNFWPSPEQRDEASTTPGADTYTFVVNVSDGTTTVPVTVTVPVIPNTAPEAADPAFTITSTTASTGRVEGVLNVIDAEEDPLTYFAGTEVDPAVGWVNVEYSTGNWSFTPTQTARDAAYESAGEDTITFSITVSDGQHSTVVTVAAPIIPDMPPQLGDPAFTITKTAGAVVEGHLNVIDAESGLTYQLTTAPDPAVGYVDYSYWNGTWTFTATEQARLDAASSAGDDVASFVITVSDGKHTIDITVDAPITPNLAAPEPEIPAFSITDISSTGVVSGEVHITDPEGDSLTYQVTTEPDSALGYVSYSWYSGSWIFTPTDQARFDAAGTSGEDAVTFVITASDGIHTTDITVEAPIVPNLTAPQSNSPAYTITGAGDWGAVYGQVHVTDPDSSYITYELDPGSIDLAVGDVQVYGNGSWTFTPTAQARLDAAAADADTTTTFTIAVSDGQYVTNVPVTVTISPNAAPVAGTPALTVTGAGAFGAIHGQFNATDKEEDQLTYELAPGSLDPNVGAFSLDSATGSWTFTPTSQARVDAAVTEGPDSVSLVFTVTDGQHTTTVPVTVDITPNAAAPHADSPAFNVTAVAAVTGVVGGTINVTDLDDPTLIYSTVSTDGTGEVVVNIDGTFTYAPNSKARQIASATPADDTATFTVSATDGVHEPVTVTVTAPISPATGFSVESFYAPWGNQGLAVSSDGRVYFTTYLVDNTAGEVVVLNSDGTYAATIDIASVTSYPLVTAYDVFIGPDGRVFISGEVAGTAAEIAEESGRGIVVAIDPDDDYAVSLFAEISSPASALTIDDSGRVYVANWNDDSIAVFNADGTQFGIIESDELAEDDDTGVAGLAVGADGKLFLSKAWFGAVKAINADGTVTDVFEVGGSPWAIDVSPIGNLYVTDSESGAILVMRPDGAVSRTIVIGGDATPSDVTVAPDGTVYAPYASDGEVSIAVITAASAPLPGATQLGAGIPGQPDGPSDVGSPVVGVDVIFQPTSSRDTTTGLVTTTVAVIKADGTTTFANAPGERFGNLVLGPDGRAYQTLTYLDESTQTFKTGVLVTSPTGVGTFTNLYAGQPAGPVVFGSGETAYQVLYVQDSATGGYTSTVLAIAPTGISNYNIAGFPGGIVHGASPAVVAPNGTVYLTTTDDSEPSTTVAVLNSTGFTAFKAKGLAGGPVSVLAEGTVLQTLVTAQIDNSTNRTSYSSTVAMLTESGFATLSGSVHGLPVGGPIEGTDSTVYQAFVTFETDASTGETGTFTTIATISDAGLVTQLERLPGLARTSDGSPSPLVAGHDGVVYLTTSQFSNDSGQMSSLVSAISSNKLIYSTEVPGQPSGPVIVGADGRAHLTTFDTAGGKTYVNILSPDGIPSSYEFDGYPGSPESPGAELIPLVIGPDGTAYQTLTTISPSADAYLTTVAIITPDGFYAPTFRGSPSGEPVLSSDGAVYLTVGYFDYQLQTDVTTVLIVSAAGLTPAGSSIYGTSAGPVTIGLDGAILQTVYSQDDEGSAVTTVHTLSPALNSGQDALLTTSELAEETSADGADGSAFHRALLTAASTGNYWVTVDAAYLAPFLLADPTFRFAITSAIVAIRGQSFEIRPMSEQEFADFADNYHASTGIGTQGFSRTSQGVLTYTNSQQEDVLVIYAPNYDQPVSGAILVRPGKTVTLPKDVTGLNAAAELPGPGRNQIAWTYRGEIPIPDAKSKNSVIAPSNNQKITYPTTLSDIAANNTKYNPGAEEKYHIDKVMGKDGKARVIVYLGGGDVFELMDNRGVFGSGTFVSQRKLVDQIDKMYNNGEEPAEILFFGYSTGGVVAQNIVATGYYKNATLITFGSPLVTSAGNYTTLHVQVNGDHAVDLFSYLNAISSNEKNIFSGTVFSFWPHGYDNYKEMAKRFDSLPSGSGARKKHSAVFESLKRFQGVGALLDSVGGNY